MSYYFWETEKERQERIQSEALVGLFLPFFLFIFVTALFVHICAVVSGHTYYPFPKEVPFTCEWSIEHTLRSSFGVRDVRTRRNRDFSFFKDMPICSPVVHDVEKLKAGKYRAFLRFTNETWNPGNLDQSLKRTLLAWKASGTMRKKVQELTLYNYTYSIKLTAKDLAFNTSQPLLPYLIKNGRIAVRYGLYQDLSSKSSYSKESARDEINTVKSQYKQYGAPLPEKWEKYMSPEKPWSRYREPFTSGKLALMIIAIYLIFNSIKKYDEWQVRKHFEQYLKNAM